MPKTDPAREALLTALEASGVSIPLWDGILIEETVRIAPGATILPGCVLRGNTTIAAGSVIGPGSVLTDAVIGKNCIVGAGSVLKGAYPAGSVIVQKRQTTATVYPLERTEK
mgnify:CR=1 FL=1